MKNTQDLIEWMADHACDVPSCSCFDRLTEILGKLGVTLEPINVWPSLD